MEPVTVHTTIARPREEVFAYLADIANHPEFSDHYLVDWRLTSEETVGTGAGARFALKGAPGVPRFRYADVTMIEVEAPWRIVEAGRGGKFNRVPLRAVYELQPSAGGTRVELTVETRTTKLADRLVEALGFRRWFKRRATKAMRRLRSILEHDEERGERATIAGR